MGRRIGKVVPVIRPSIQNLGVIASAIMRLTKEMDGTAEELNDDLHAFGAPAECFGMVFGDWDDKIEKERNKIFEKFNITEDDYQAALRSRIKITYWANHYIY